VNFKTRFIDNKTGLTFKAGFMKKGKIMNYIALLIRNENSMYPKELP